MALETILDSRALARQDLVLMANDIEDIKEDLSKQINSICWQIHLLGSLKSSRVKIFWYKLKVNTLQRRVNDLEAIHKWVVGVAENMDSAPIYELENELVALWNATLPDIGWDSVKLPRQIRAHLLSATANLSR